MPNLESVAQRTKLDLQAEITWEKIARPGTYRAYSSSSRLYMARISITAWRTPSV